MIALGTFGGGEGYAYALNDLDQVVGTAKNIAGVFRPFIWDATTRVLVDLNELLPHDATDWEIIYPMDINNAGVIVGQARHAGQLRAYRLSP
jgi:hypothetical protein